MKCQRCGTEFEGRYCPNCGEAVGSAPPVNDRENREAPPPEPAPMPGRYYETRAQVKEPFLAKTWFVLLMLLFCCFPFGLFLMWKYKKFNKPARVILTAVLCVCYMWSIANMLAFSKVPSIPSSPSAQTAGTAAAARETKAHKSEPEAAKSPKAGQKSEPAQDTKVPAEYKSALKKAQSYSSIMHMSKAGIYEQLTSEYGEQFTAEAAQYAIDNMEADWNANALEKAKSYSDTLYMSKLGIYDQLISEYGDRFTPDEAQYAVDNADIDWNRNALEKAKSYQSTMNMSPAAIHDQLISEYGEKFTREQADYAIANLN